MNDEDIIVDTLYEFLGARGHRVLDSITILTYLITVISLWQLLILISICGATLAILKLMRYCPRGSLG